LDFLFERLPYQHDLASPQGKTAAVEELLPALRDLADPIERAHYVQRLAGVVGVPEAAVAELTRPAVRRPAVPAPTVQARLDRWEECALALVALGVPTGTLAENDFGRPECRALFRWLHGAGAESGARAAGPPPELAATWATVKGLAEESAGQPSDRLRGELDNTTLELRKRRLAREEWEINNLVRDHEGAAPRELAERLAGLAAQRAELERAQAARGRVVASAWRFQAVKEDPGD